MATAMQTRSLSPYIEILEAEISEDLCATIKPEDLRDEVRKTLLREIMRQGAVALSELEGVLLYHSSNDSKIQQAEAKLSRHLGYIQELLALRSAQRIDPSRQLSNGKTKEEVF